MKSPRTFVTMKTQKTSRACAAATASLCVLLAVACGENDDAPAPSADSLRGEPIQTAEVRGEPIKTPAAPTEPEASEPVSAESSAPAPAVAKGAAPAEAVDVVAAEMKQEISLAAAEAETTATAKAEETVAAVTTVVEAASEKVDPERVIAAPEAKVSWKSVEKAAAPKPAVVEAASKPAVVEAVAPAPAPEDTPAPAPNPALEEEPVVVKSEGQDYLTISFDRLASFEYEMPDEFAEVSGAGDDEQAEEGEAKVEKPEEKPEEKDQIPPTVRKFNNQCIALEGFMLPLKVEDSLVTEMLIMRDQSMCCFGSVPKINEWVSIRMTGKGVKPVMDEPVTIYGKLKVGEVRENGYLVGIYEMDGERMGSRIDL